MISAIFNKKYVIVDDSLFIFDGNNILTSHNFILYV